MDDNRSNASSVAVEPNQPKPNAAPGNQNQEPKPIPPPGQTTDSQPGNKVGETNATSSKTSNYKNNLFKPPKP